MVRNVNRSKMREDELFESVFRGKSLQPCTPSYKRSKSTKRNIKQACTVLPRSFPYVQTSTTSMCSRHVSEQRRELGKLCLSTRRNVRCKIGPGWRARCIMRQSARRNLRSRARAVRSRARAAHTDSKRVRSVQSAMQTQRTTACRSKAASHSREGAGSAICPPLSEPMNSFSSCRYARGSVSTRSLCPAPWT